MSPKPRRAYHHGHLREATIAAAVELVDQGEPLGLRELGRRLGVSHAAVHHHFPSVDALATELATRWFADLDAALAAAVATLTVEAPARAMKPTRGIDRVAARAIERSLERHAERPTEPAAQRALDRFRALGVGYVHYAIERPHRYRLQFRGGPAGLVQGADASFRRVLEAVMACAPHAGRPVDPLTTTILAWSAMHGLAMLWIDGAFRAQLDRSGIDALAARIAALISQLLE